MEIKLKITQKKSNSNLQGIKEQIHKEPIFWEHEDNKAVRMGDYKLVQDWEKGIDDNWELYNISRDELSKII